MPGILHLADVFPAGRPQMKDSQALSFTLPPTTFPLRLILAFYLYTLPENPFPLWPAIHKPCQKSACH